MNWIAAFPLLLAALAAVAWRRTHDWFFLLAGFLAALTAAATLATGGPSIFDVPRGLVAIALLCVFTVWAFGLPAPLARRIGWGLRDREREFDARLTRDLRALNRIFDGEPGPEGELHAHWLRRARSQGPKVVGRMARLRAPDERWQALLDEYVEVYAAIFVDLGESVSVDGAARLRARFGAVCERHTALREARFGGHGARLAGQDPDGRDEPRT